MIIAVFIANLNYDICAIASDLVGDADAPLPTSKSQEKKWSKEIRARLSDWVSAEIVPRLKHDLEQNGLPATVRAEGDKVFIDYAPLVTGTGYVAPAVMLEFGARSTGEPSEPRAIHCDAAAYLQGGGVSHRNTTGYARRAHLLGKGYGDSRFLRAGQVSRW